jgi:outer membrane receptor protein involved in Fe transport
MVLPKLRNLKYQNMEHISKLTQKPVSLAILALIFLQTAEAQTAPTDSDAPGAKPAVEATQKSPEPQKLETVVISGSRIKKDNFSSSAPVTIIRKENSTLAGFTSTGQVLQSTSVTGGQGQINNAYGGYVTDGGPGANTIGLRGLDPTRTLVLLNGRRLSPSGTRGSVGAVDLNILPDAIIDRVEILKDGASSIYGSDAIAGVVNIITKKNLNSITVDGSTSVTQDGGGNAHNFSISGGKVTDNSRFLASFQINQQESLTLGQRDWTQCNTDYRRTYDPDSGVVGEWGSFDFVDPRTGKPKCYPISGTGSNGVTINTLGTPLLPGVGAAGSAGTSFTRWRPNAAVTTGLVGYEGVGGNINVRDTFDPRTLNRSLLSPVRNQNFYAQGGVDLHTLGDAELYYEVLLNRRESQQTGFRQLALDYMQGSPLIPTDLQFGTRFLGPQATTNGANVGVRAFIGFGNDESSQTVDFGRLAVGLRGAVANTGWDYDTTLVSSHSSASYTFSAFLTDRLAQSSNVVANGSGGFNCVDPSNGCVAAPALTAAVIGGQLPANWVNYVWQPATGATKYREDVLSASATGPVFTLPYGKVKAAIGVESRKMSIDDTPAADSIAGNLYNFTSSTPTRGSDQANDVYGEIEVPLLKNLPAFQELTFNASARSANYESYGRGSTHKTGLLWTPVNWLTVRGTNGTSYRAPALYEQFLGATSGFLSNQADPCNNWDSPSNAGTVRSANCQSEGLPAGFNATQGIAVIGVGGREAGLKAETSTNKSLGIIFQPALPSGWGDLSLSVDRFDIQVDNGVANVGGSSILNRCYDDPAFRAGGSFCRLVAPRAASTNALSVTNGFINLATDVVRGLDFASRYTNDVGLGQLVLNFSATEYKEQSNRLFADDPTDDTNGTIGQPRWSGAMDAKYTLKGWSYYYALEYVGKTSSYEYYEEDPATSTFKLDTPGYFLQSASIQYKDTVGKWSATFGVRNLADVKPPVISAQAGYDRVGNAPLYSGYDYTGRRFYVNVSKTF